MCFGGWRGPDCSVAPLRLSDCASECEQHGTESCLARCTSEAVGEERQHCVTKCAAMCISLCEMRKVGGAISSDRGAEVRRQHAATAAL